MITKLKMAMFVKEVSQADVARKAGCHRAYINRIVAGKQKPSKKIKEAFNKYGIKVESEK